MSMQGNKKRRSKVTVDLPDDLIQELLIIGKQNHISVRQFIRQAFSDLAGKSIIAEKHTPQHTSKI